MLHGDVTNKAPVLMEELLGTQLRQNILVEGAPGVGKTTLSREICNRWAKGEGFQEFSLILLLQFGEKRVQNAKTIRDLFLHGGEEQLEAVANDIKDTSGNRLLIILECSDKLPEHLFTLDSIFGRLLTGEEIPDATIMVTSRPSAAAQLFNWRFRFTSHVEILGFTKESISAYVDSENIFVSDFDDYFCMTPKTPSIRELMCIPLYSAIMVVLYRDSDTSLPCNEMKFCSELVNTVLRRYLRALPDYPHTDIEHFTDLPLSVYLDFKELTELAYNCIVKQEQVVRDKDKLIEHFGLMKMISNPRPLRFQRTYSYIFLHSSIQEYLGAIHVSMMGERTQEKLLKCTEGHLKHRDIFIATIEEEKKRKGAHKVHLGECTPSQYIFCLTFTMIVVILHLFLSIYI